MKYKIGDIVAVKRHEDSAIHLNQVVMDCYKENNTYTIRSFDSAILENEIYNNELFLTIINQ